jgi:hypothetical protein
MNTRQDQFDAEMLEEIRSDIRGVHRSKFSPRQKLEFLTEMFSVWLAHHDLQDMPIGTRVRKKSGSRWQGRVVGYYSTELTPQGVCIESENEPGSVQIYPIKAVEILEGATPHPDEQELQDILSEAMSDIHDMDTTTTDFAKACVKKLQELKIIP